MTTPFDTPRRLARRRVDDIRIAISVELGIHEKLDEAARALDNARQHELAVESNLPAIFGDRWLHRMNRQRDQLRADSRRAGERLARLRAEAIEAYGAVRALDDAAERHEKHAAHALAKAEQAALDDISAARIATIRRVLARQHRA